MNPSLAVVKFGMTIEAVDIAFIRVRFETSPRDPRKIHAAHIEFLILGIAMVKTECGK